MRTKFTLLAIFISLTAFSQAPPWQWARQAGVAWNEVGHSCSVDKNGNVYAVGRYDGASITFGTTTLVNSDISSQTEEIFIVKYDPLGNVIWAKTAGGTSNEYPLSCAADTSGNLFITGYFQSSAIVFDTITLTQTFNGYLNMFIVKYDPNGNVIWGRSAGGNSSDGGQSCAVDKNGNVIVSGYFYSTSITFGTTTLINAGGADVFIVKYDPSGNLIWARSSAGHTTDGGCSCSLDTIGNIFVSGSFNSPIMTFGTITINNVDPSGNTKDIFIVKYDPNGNVLWAKSAGGTMDEVGYGCAAMKNGGVYITGSFNSPSIPFSTDILHNTPNFYNYPDVFILKYDPSGNPEWARAGSGGDSEYGWSCSCDEFGNVMITGPYSSPSIIFGSDTLLNYDNTASSSDIFLVKYEPSGNVFWLRTIGGDWDDGVNCCTTDKFGNSYITGGFQSYEIGFGPDTLTNIGTNDFFIAKLDTIFGASISSLNVLCNQPCSGTAMANPQFGVAPYSYSWSNSQTTQTITGLCAGIYSVLVVDANNDSATASVTIANIPLPTVTFNQIQTNMCVNWGVRTLTAATPSGGTYSGTAVSGNTFNATTAGVGTFTIIYTYTDLNGCSNADTSYITVNACLGIEPVENNFSFSISPNPSSGRFIIDSEVTKGEIEIYNSLGEKVYSSAIISDKTEIDLSEKSKGIYFIRIQSEEKISSRKIVIE